MYLVTISTDNYPSKHSIWNTDGEALKQKTVLLNNGYKNVNVTCIETEKYENGHYFV